MDAGMTTSIPSTTVPDSPAGPIAAGAALSQMLAASGTTGSLTAEPTSFGGNPAFADLLSDSTDIAAATVPTAPVASAALTGPTSASGNDSTLSAFSGGILRVTLQTGAGGPSFSGNVSDPSAGSRLTAKPSLRMTLLGALDTGKASSELAMAPVETISSAVEVAQSDSVSSPELTHSSTSAVLPSREQLEAAAATLLAPLLALLQQVAAPAAALSTQPTGDVNVTIQLDDGPPQSLTLPASAFPDLKMGQGSVAADPAALVTLASDLVGMLPVQANTVSPSETTESALPVSCAEPELADKASAPAPSTADAVTNNFTRLSAAPTVAYSRPASVAIPTSASLSTPVTQPTSTAQSTAITLPATTAIPASIPEATPSKLTTSEDVAAPLQADIQLADGTTLRIALQPVAATSSNSPANTPAATMANSAASAASGAGEANIPDSRGEKHILTVEGKGDGIAKAKAGIAVAEGPASMFAPSYNRNHAAALFAEPSAMLRSAFVDMLSAPVAAAAGQTASTPDTASATPVVAQRAVETVLGLIDTQIRQADQNAGTVNLNFKFGHEDLSVRVQMRGGEIHTQFRTDSPELRAALATQWRTVTASAPTTQSRLADPEIVPATASTVSGFQTSAQNQNSFQQQASQQGSHALVPPELRPLRRFSPETAAEPAPRSPSYNPGSIHLTALA